MHSHECLLVIDVTVNYSFTALTLTQDIWKHVPAVRLPLRSSLETSFNYGKSGKWLKPLCAFIKFSVAAYNTFSPLLGCLQVL